MVAMTSGQEKQTQTKVVAGHHKRDSYAACCSCGARCKNDKANYHDDASCAEWHAAHLSSLRQPESVEKPAPLPCEKSHAIGSVAWKMRHVIAIPKFCGCGAELYPEGVAPGKMEGMEMDANRLTRKERQDSIVRIARESEELGEYDIFLNPDE